MCETSILSRLLKGRCAKAMLLAAWLQPPGFSNAQTIGPSPPTRTTTITVNSGTTTVVGNTIVSTTGTTNATSVLGGILIFDPGAGPSPGAISVTTDNGHAGFVGSASSSLTMGSGTTINTTGLGTALAAIGGTINATGVTISAGGTSTGFGAIAESGGSINLHSGTAITRGTATSGINTVGIGASGSGSNCPSSEHLALMAG